MTAHEAIKELMLLAVRLLTESAVSYQLRSQAYADTDKLFVTMERRRFTALCEAAAAACCFHSTSLQNDFPAVGMLELDCSCMRSGRKLQFAA